MKNLAEKLQNINNEFVIAIDGPSGVGKSTLGKILSRRLGLKYFQSSLFYRVIASACINNSINIDDPTEVSNVLELYDINAAVNTDLHGESVGAIASKIATISVVREHIAIKLRDIISSNKRIIMEGRDIGTTIAPQADLKLFLTANLMTRAQRRYKQLHNMGKDSILSEIIAQLDARDKRDEERQNSPLIPAQDALVLDTGNLSIEELVKKIEHLILRG